MALASPRQPPPTVRQLTPPSSSHGGLGQASWDFAVPLNNNPKAFPTDQTPFMAEGYPSAPLASQPNGYSKTVRSTTLDSQRQHYEEDQTYLGPTPVTELHRKRSDITANGSDPDSVQDHAKPPESKTRSRNASRNRARKKGSLDPNWVEVEKNDANWIHRDKLKEIETRELEEAGFRVGRASRSSSNAQNTTRTSRDRNNSEAATDSALNGDERPDHRRLVSPIPAVEEPEEERERWDLRTAEEIAEETNWTVRSSNNNHSVRPSTSRIPVAKTSPLPVPSTFVERDAPLPRPRTGSNNWNGDAIAANGARVRSGSVSSQNLLDEPGRVSGELSSQNNPSHPTSAVSKSPTKSKTPAKSTSAPAGRKTSAQRSNSQAKNRNGSGPSAGKRPGTSGGAVSRPTTGHRPEGEAPWIATMYKPDPRLPPDQQIIPTHAKRMQQEQWETEGRVGSMYGRDFKLLNTDEFKDKRSSQILSPELDQLEKFEKPDDDPEWPLPSPTKQTMEPLVKSPTNEQGGYKLTPTIPQSPRIPSRAESSRAARIPSPQPTKTTRLPEPPAEDVKEKKNCCCIVM